MSRSRTPPRVLLVEDDPSLRSAVAAALGETGYEVCALADGTTAHEVGRSFRPDLAVLDVRLAGGPSGLSVAAVLRDHDRDLPIFFLTAADSVEDRVKGFEAGGDDYLVKPFAMVELLARVKALLRRSGRLESSVWTCGPLTIDEESRCVLVEGQEIELTRIEFGLLIALSRRPGRTLSKAQLLTTLWGFDAYDPNLVEVHVSALRRKLGPHGPEMIRTVRGHGYVLRP